MPESTGGSVRPIAFKTASTRAGDSAASCIAPLKNSPAGACSRCRSSQKQRTYLFLLTCSGLPLRDVDAILRSSGSLIEPYIDLEAPLSELFDLLCSSAEMAAPAASCCAFDLAGMIVNSCVRGTRA